MRDFNELNNRMNKIQTKNIEIKEKLETNQTLLTAVDKRFEEVVTIMENTMIKLEAKANIK